jgi:hypothetical protein
LHYNWEGVGVLYVGGGWGGKNPGLFLFLFFSLLSFSACDIPNAVEIKGNPELAFPILPVDMDVAEEISSALSEGIADIEGASIITCRNTPYLTCLIYIDMPLDIRVPIPSGTLFQVDSQHSENFLVLYEDGESISIPLSSMSDYLEDFALSEAKVKLYLRATYENYTSTSGETYSFNEMVEAITLQMIINNVEQPPFKIEGHNVGLSGLKDTTVWDSNKMPDGGHEIPGLAFDGEDKTLNFKALLMRGDSISMANKKNAKLAIEAMVWVPFVLKAGPNGGKLKFPPDIFAAEGEDFFNRAGASSESLLPDFIQGLGLSIKYNSNIFDNALLVVESVTTNPYDEIRIENRLRGNSLNFSIDGYNLNKINSHFPFRPNLTVEFAPNSRLAFPRNFMVNEIALKAKIHHRIEW